VCRDADATSWLMGELDFDAGGNTFPFLVSLRGGEEKAIPWLERAHTEVLAWVTVGSQPAGTWTASQLS